MYGQDNRQFAPTSICTVQVKSAIRLVSPTVDSDNASSLVSKSKSDERLTSCARMKVN